MPLLWNPDETPKRDPRGSNVDASLLFVVMTLVMWGVVVAAMMWRAA